jgi:hypothetical protein
MQELAESDRDLLVQGLGRALASQAAHTMRPGQLRHRLNEELGQDDAQRLRRDVHRLVAAAEENIAAHITRRLPLTSQALGRLAGDLSDRRGWTWSAASSTAEVWAAALGSPVRAEEPDPLRDSSSARPPAAPLPLVTEETALPPDTSGPSGPDPENPALPTSHAVARPEWPETSKHVAAKLAQATAVEPYHAATLAYGGIPFLAFASGLITLTVLMCLPVILLDARGPLLAVLAALLALPLVHLAGYGILRVTDEGVVFLPYAGALSSPRPDQAIATRWGDLRVEEGWVSSLWVDGHRVQLGPRSGRFARAVAARATQDRP